MGEYYVGNPLSVIEAVASVSKNPAKDLLIQAVDNSIDAINLNEEDKKIDIYFSEMNGLNCLIVEDNGHGMDEKYLENYRDIAGSMKKWTLSKGFYGIGRFAYIKRSQKGVFVETCFEENHYKNTLYTLINNNENVNEITFRSEIPDLHEWEHYDKWLLKNNIDELERGTRVLMWNLDKHILQEVKNNGIKWISREYPELLDRINIYFDGYHVKPSPPSFKWNIKISMMMYGENIEGRIYYCRNELDEPGIGIRAINRTVNYTFFDISGYDNIKKKVCGWIDINKIIDTEMINASKDEIVECSVKKEIWMKLRSKISDIFGKWEAKENARKYHKSHDVLRGIENLLSKTMKMLEQDPRSQMLNYNNEEDEKDEEDEDEEDKNVDPIIIENEEKPLEETKDGRFKCSICNTPLSRSPDEEGVIESLKFVRRKCPHCGYPFKKKIHKSILGKGYRIYICKNQLCGHHNFRVDMSRYGFKIEMIDENWRWDENLEYYWEDKFYINVKHNNFKNANRSSRKWGIEWPNIDKMENIFHTPLEYHIVNCVASSHAIKQLGENINIMEFFSICNEFKSIYYEGRFKSKAAKI